MKHARRTLAALLAALLLAALLALPVSAQTPAEAKDLALGYIARNLPAPAFGEEWFVLAQARGGVVNPQYYRDYYSRVESYVRGRGSAKLSSTRSTENARVILALSAIGKGAASVGGYDLTAPFTEMAWVTSQGVNGPVHALLALDSGGYGTAELRGTLLAYILDHEMASGGWSFSGFAADPDMTSMALQALAAYRDDADVADAIGRALPALSAMQNANGGFSYEDEGANAESIAQVIIALTALGIDPQTDARFVKAGGNPVSALLGYQLANGGFKHKPADTTADGMATDQAARALVAYDRFAKGLSGLYDTIGAEDLTVGGSAAQPKWWESPPLPAWLHLLLRWLLFGWIWMGFA